MVHSAAQVAIKIQVSFGQILFRLTTYLAVQKNIKLLLCFTLLFIYNWWNLKKSIGSMTSRCMVISSGALAAWSLLLVRGDHGPIQDTLAPLMTPRTVLPFAVINAFRVAG